MVLYAYNGLGDRLSQNGIQYTLDLNDGLTQVLSDGTNTYTYGLGRISQQQGNTPEYFLGDALGSVRQLTNQAGAITYSTAYDPYGVVTQASGASVSAYGYTNEYTSQGLVYLRSRYYSPEMGRFLTQDSWQGNYNKPLSLNRWNYGYGNPVKYTDPSGKAPHPFAFNGYAEGRINVNSAGIWVFAVSGTEMVYDFETLERTKFQISNWKNPSDEAKVPTGWCLTGISIGAAPYYSFIGGFDQEGIEADYGGNTKSYVLGVSVPIELAGGAGLGGVAFHSETRQGFFEWPDVWGVSFYIGELTIGGFADPLVTIAGIDLYYSKISRTPYTNIDEMIHDIKSGDESPLATTPLESLVRDLAIRQLREYREMRE